MTQIIICYYIPIVAIDFENFYFDFNINHDKIN